MPVGEPRQHFGSVGRGGKRREYSRVILVDANILIYATDPRSENHQQARNWLDGQLSGDTRVGLPWESLLAYMRIVTSPRIFERPQTVTIAWRHVEAWLDCECVWAPVPGPAHRSILT